MRRISADLVLDVVSERSGIAREAIFHRVRDRSIVLARQTAVYLCARLTSLSYAAIGRCMGLQVGTVLFARQTVRERMATTPSYEAFVRELCAEILRRARI